MCILNSICSLISLTFNLLFSCYSTTHSLSFSPNASPLKESLVELCQSQGLLWVEDPTNRQLITPRNEIRRILCSHPELQEGLADAMELFREAKSTSEPWVRRAMLKVALVDKRHGTVSFSASSYRSLNPYIARSALAIWLRYTSASTTTIPQQNLHWLHNAVIREHSSSLSGSNHCTLIPLPKAGRYMIAKCGLQIKVPITVGETIFWDNRFEIKLIDKPTSKTDSNRSLNQHPDQPTSQTEAGQRVYYVRNFHKKFNCYLSKGLRKIKQSVLVHPHARTGLPLVMDGEGKVVLIPHFRVINHSEGIDCGVEFSPQWSMEQLLEFSYVSVDSLPSGDRVINHL